MNLAQRMKRYESPRLLTPKVPVIVRVDGRAFHTLTEFANKPFDGDFMSAMAVAAYRLGREIPGFKFGYVQSDEVSLLLMDTDRLETQPWFDYNCDKLNSIIASMMTLFFNRAYRTVKQVCVFDARSFNIPQSDIANYFLWRAQDWERNSLNMFVRAFFSQKDLNGKNRAEIHEMLFSKGKNWAHLTEAEKNGTFFDTKNLFYSPPKFAAINKLLTERNIA